VKAQNDRLIVRHHERYRCQAPVRLVIDPVHAEAVVLSKLARSADGSVPATLVDCSLGGLGVMSRVFVPRACRILIVTGIGEGDQDENSCPIGEYSVRVQRVTLVGREPTYLLGTLLGSDEGEGEGSIEQAAQLQHLISFARSQPGVGDAARA